MRSIRRQLLVILLTTLGVSFAVSGLLGYLTTADEVHELFDAQLIENARVLKGVMNHPADKVDWARMRASLEETRRENISDDNLMAEGHAYEKKVAIQVWSNDGNLVLRSPSAPEYSLAALRHGFTRRQSGDHTWFVYATQMPENSHWLLVAERSDVREELTTNIAASLGIGSLAGFILAILLMRRGLRHELQPLEDLRAAIKAREPGQQMSIELTRRRAELEPVVAALNDLLERVTTSVERERRFLADAAHELRTPLAVLRLQAQNTIAASSTEEKHQQLEKLISGVDRSTRVVEQMLLLARLDADAIPLLPEKVALDLIARDTLASLAPLAFARQQELVLESDDSHDFPLQGHPVLLGAMLRNLVENALRHTPDGGEVSVHLISDKTQITLAVSDQGPGADPALLGELTRRFVRGSHGDTQGAGLGLAIVAHIVSLHQGRLHLTNREGGGLTVSVTLPRQ
jgi:two-component system, OmpR family, sensor histidine kinase QseC